MLNEIGLGYRRDLSDDINNGLLKPDFVELAPENWIGLGGYWKKQLDEMAEQYSISCHGLSLSLGSSEPLDWEYLKKLKVFLKQYDVKMFSEHLSYTKSANAHIYDLLPIPFRKDAVNFISQRISEVQDFLERKIAIENVSYYTPVAAQMDEVDFIGEIVDKSNCQLLLDVNNVYVNSFNHKYDAHDFIKKLPLDKVAYIHMAGHEKVSDDLIIDTHGNPIIYPVYELFEWTTKQMNSVPVLLERDFNFDDIAQINTELSTLRDICDKNWNTQQYVA